MYREDDTIVAISTPPGRSGIGVVRISGDRAAEIARALLGMSDPLEPRRALFGHVREDASAGKAGDIVDQIVCTWFPAPRSYTGEDVVEISGHGNPLLLGRIVRSAVDQGARPALPGEFTFRAFLHGKLDLVQAEAVADLIEAVTPAQARAACDQLEGTLTRAIGEVEHELFSVRTRLEASLDFPEDGYHFIDRSSLRTSLERCAAQVERLLASASRGRMLREGRHVVIVGRPNVGKSSLFNALLGVDRAIVTEVAGTTRDLLTERCEIGGLAITLVDTAGLRPAGEIVEREGIARAHDAASVADLMLVVVDGSQPLEPADEALVFGPGLPGPRIIIVSKVDLHAAWDPAALRARNGGAVVIGVSVVDRTGIDELQVAIPRALGAVEPLREQVLVTHLRHACLLERSAEAIRDALQATLNGASEEFVVADVQEAMDALQEVTGRRGSEAVLQEIFSRFCIGK
jgi:tRNA modification GTPase